MLFRKGLGFEIRSMFLDSDNKLAVLSVYSSRCDTFRLLAGYAPSGVGQPFFRAFRGIPINVPLFNVSGQLESFLGCTSGSCIGS